MALAAPRGIVACAIGHVVTPSGARRRPVASQQVEGAHVTARHRLEGVARSRPRRSAGPSPRQREHPLLDLQGRAGNRAVQRLVAGSAPRVQRIWPFDDEPSDEELFPAVGEGTAGRRNTDARGELDEPESLVTGADIAEFADSVGRGVSGAGAATGAFAQDVVEELPIPDGGVKDALGVAAGTYAETVTRFWGGVATSGVSLAGNVVDAPEKASEGARAVRQGVATGNTEAIVRGTGKLVEVAGTIAEVALLGAGSSMSVRARTGRGGPAPTPPAGGGRGGAGGRGGQSRPAERAPAVEEPGAGRRPGAAVSREEIKAQILAERARILEAHPELSLREATEMAKQFVAQKAALRQVQNVEQSLEQRMGDRPLKGPADPDSLANRRRGKVY